jgi:hypothetical protein
MTHGILSGTIVLEGESAERFHTLLDDLLVELQPQTTVEITLVENMAVARWRQMRIWGMEKAGMDHEMRRQAGTSNSVSTEDNATRASLAFRTLSDDGRSIELINRYDTRYERQYYRAHRRFLEVRDRRTPSSDSPANQRCSGEGTFPTGGSARIHEMPIPAPAEKVEESKGTREVLANKAAPVRTPGSRSTPGGHAFQRKRVPRAQRRALRRSYRVPSELFAVPQAQRVR